MKVLKLVIMSVCGFGLAACNGGSKDKSYAVNSSVNQGGAVNVAQATVSSGNTTSFSFTPDTGYHLKSVTGCNGTLSGTTYTTGAVTADCTVTANFERNTYVLTVNATAGGSFTIQNAAPEHGSSTQVVALPNSGYGVENFSGCGAGTADYSVYTTGPITANCAVALSFKQVVAIQGAAAEGAALVGAQVNAKCSDGSTFTTKVTTDASGKFIGQVGEQAFPCALKVTTAAPVKTYYSIATQSGTTNINLLTDISLVLASGKSGADWFASNDWANVKANLAKAQSALKESLYNLGYVLPAGELQSFTAQFQLGDAWDKLLDQINVGISKTPGMTYESLIGLLKSGNANQVPSPTGGSEPTAEVCFNPVLYAEGTTLTTTSSKETLVEGNTTYYGYQSIFTTINKKIFIENELPVLTAVTNTIFNDYYLNMPIYFNGENKWIVDLAKKTVGIISYGAKIKEDSNFPEYYTGYYYSGNYKDLGYQTHFKTAKDVPVSNAFIFTTGYFFDGQDNSSESTINYTKTFKGLTKFNVAGTDYRVCDFEVQSTETNRHSFIDGSVWEDSSSVLHDYLLVGSGVLITDSMSSAVLNGQELLNGQPN